MHIPAVKDFVFEPVEQAYSWRDTVLYALSLGYGANPVDPADLRFVYEKGLVAVPSQCVVLAHPGFWARRPEFGIDWVRLLHGEQGFEVHRRLPVEGTVTGVSQIDAIDDKGPDKGAAVYQSKKLYDKDTGDLLATIRTTLFLRGDGGCGTLGIVPPPPPPLPARDPDRTVELPTLPQQALLYRLNGDLNPIHADPVLAAEAGFPQPILHGLCTFGLATRAVLSACAPDRPERLKSMFARFSKPVFPGETIVAEFFDSPDGVRFRCRVKERDEVVLDRGTAVLAD